MKVATKRRPALVDGEELMPEDHPLSVAAARTLALQNTDIVLLIGAWFNWVFHPRFIGAGFGQPTPLKPRVGRGV